MDTKILNYRIIVEPDYETGTHKPGYTALCPTLGVADDGDTIEQALKNVKKAIQKYVDSLIKDGEPIPADKPDKDFITTAAISVPASFQPAL